MNRIGTGLFIAATALIVGCVTDATRSSALGPAEIRNGPAKSTVRYDRGSGTCSSGALQLLTKEAVDALVDDWEAPQENCEGPDKTRLPAYGDYPGQAVRERKSGSAHVLVRLEANGHVESVRAVCASDAGFGLAAEETTKRIRFAPMTCEGQPTRVAFFLPLDYDI